MGDRHAAKSISTPCGAAWMADSKHDFNFDASYTLKHESRKTSRQAQKKNQL
jgi:hypothetical protein